MQPAGGLPFNIGNIDDDDAVIEWIRGAQRQVEVDIQRMNENIALAIEERNELAVLEANRRRLLGGEAERDQGYESEEEFNLNRENDPVIRRLRMKRRWVDIRLRKMNEDLPELIERRNMLVRRRDGMVRRDEGYDSENEDPGEGGNDQEGEGDQELEQEQGLEGEEGLQGDGEIDIGQEAQQDADQLERELDEPLNQCNCM